MMQLGMGILDKYLPLNEGDPVDVSKTFLPQGIAGSVVHPVKISQLIYAKFGALTGREFDSFLATKVKPNGADQIAKYLKTLNNTTATMLADSLVSETQ